VQPAVPREPRINRRTGLLVEALAALILTGLLLAAANWAAGLYLARRVEASLAATRDPASQDFAAGVLASMDINPVPLVPDPELLWRNRPGSQKTQPVNPEAYDRPASWSVTVDARGYRSGPPGLEADHPGVYRILCVGDSVTYGFNVDAEDTYPKQLEALLERRYPDRHFEVINAGVPGWSWIQGRRYLEVEGLALRPDVVVIGHGTNDQFFPTTVTDSERIGHSTSWISRAYRRLAIRLANTNLYRLASALSPRRSEPGPGCAAQPSGACRRVGIPEIEAAIGEIDAMTRAAGANLLLLNTDFMETPAVEGLRRAEAAVPLRTLDLVARFRSLRTEAEEREERTRGLLPAGPLELSPSADAHTVTLRADNAPRVSALRAVGSGYLESAFQFDEPMYDDGTHGDERAQDGVFTVTLAVPAGVHAIEYRFVADGRPEFRPLPPFPSTQGVRMLPVGQGVRGPIETFGALAYMAERTHPNAEGQGIVAAAVADELAALPSLQRMLQSPLQDESRDASRR
jgi:lysophospholipase L1-like esterase